MAGTKATARSKTTKAKATKATKAKATKTKAEPKTTETRTTRQPLSQVRSDNRLTGKQEPNPDPNVAGTGTKDGKTYAQRIDDGDTKLSQKPSISLSSPLAENTQLFITGRNFPPRESALVKIKTPFGVERRSSRADLYGNVQVALHSPDAGKHSVTIKAGKKSKSADFEVVGRQS